MDATAGPSKRPRMSENLNDSFYDSEEDELVSQACCVSVNVTPKAAPLMHSNMRTPTSSIAARQGQLPTSATTLKGKPLTPSSTSIMADDDDVSVIHTSKPFFRLAKEVKELSEERDNLKGQSLFLEQSLRSKEKESQEHLQKIAELTQKYTEALEEIREIQRRSDEEIIHLRTQLQFQTEQSKADTFKGGKLKIVGKDACTDFMGTPMDEDMRPAGLVTVQNVTVPVIKPRMSTSSINKSFSSALKPRLSRGVGSHSHGMENEDVDAFTENLDENVVAKETEEKCIQTDAFRIADVITNPDILAKREIYDSILNTMIGATFIIEDTSESSERISEKSAAAFDTIVNINQAEHSLNQILQKERRK